MEADEHTDDQILNILVYHVYPDLICALINFDRQNWINTNEFCYFQAL